MDARLGGARQAWTRPGTGTGTPSSGYPHRSWLSIASMSATRVVSPRRWLTARCRSSGGAGYASAAVWPRGPAHRPELGTRGRDPV